MTSRNLSILRFKLFLKIHVKAHSISKCHFFQIVNPHLRAPGCLDPDVTANCSAPGGGATVSVSVSVQNLPFSPHKLAWDGAPRPPSLTFPAPSPPVFSGGNYHLSINPPNIKPPGLYIWAPNQDPQGFIFGGGLYNFNGP